MFISISLEETRDLLDRAFKENDVIITTGGVSMGEKVSMAAQIEDTMTVAMWKPVLTEVNSWRLFSVYNLKDPVKVLGCTLVLLGYPVSYGSI